MDSQKYEDSIFKMACEYFGEAVLPFFNIHDPIAGIGPTEISLLTIEKKYLDFTFLTTADKYLHFEFQSTNGGIADLRRFHAYEALLHYSTGKEVITYFIFTGGIRTAVFEESYGINTYHTIPIYMAQKDADLILEHIIRKKNKGTDLTDEDFVQLALTPVMSSRRSMPERIMTAVRLLKDETRPSAAHAIAMVYAFAEKMMPESKELQEIKGVMLMTRLGQMIFDDGLEQGREQGLKQGREQGLKQGLEQGLEQGREEGHRQGREEGHRQGRDEMAELTRRLLQENRLEDLRQAVNDRDFCQKLLHELAQEDTDPSITR